MLNSFRQILWLWNILKINNINPRETSDQTYLIKCIKSNLQFTLMVYIRLKYVQQYFNNYLKYLDTSSCLYYLFPSPRNAVFSHNPVPSLRSSFDLSFETSLSRPVCPSVYKCACPLWDDLHEWLSGLSIIPGHAPFVSQRKMIGWWWYFVLIFLERCNTPPFCLFNISLIWP